MIPDELRYTREHEWIRVEADVATLGITDYAQDSLGDIVYLETPNAGMKVESGQEIGEVESTKTTSPIYTPVSGTILEINPALKNQPEIINMDPYHQGWILKIRMNDPSQAAGLLSAGEYGDHIKKDGE
jgi:glycine cleavage system H protein